MHIERQILKQQWLNLPASTAVTKTIVVEMNKNKKFWIGYGYVSITSDGPNGYTHFATHQEFPMEYALNREEYKSGEYKLVIK
tara:strand:- start:128 stop:376 length:249 start_codon:yes stop_codon:yes gene_type:complete